MSFLKTPYSLVTFFLTMSFNWCLHYLFLMKLLVSLELSLLFYLFSACSLFLIPFPHPALLCIIQTFSSMIIFIAFFTLSLYILLKVFMLSTTMYILNFHSPLKFNILSFQKECKRYHLCASCFLFSISCILRLWEAFQAWGETCPPRARGQPARSMPFLYRLPDAGRCPKPSHLNSHTKPTVSLPCIKPGPGNRQLRTAPMPQSPQELSKLADPQWFTLPCLAFLLAPASAS